MSFVSAQTAAGQARRLLRGKVVDSADMPVPNAVVTQVDNAHEWRVDSLGRFALFAESEASVNVIVRALGFAAARAALASNRVNMVVLQRAVATLPTASAVSSRKRRHPVADDRSADSSATVRAVGFGAVSSEDQGDMKAAVAALPGVVTTSAEPSGGGSFAVFGLGPDESVLTLDGVRILDAYLPRDLVVAQRLVTISSDAALGGFSGALFDVRLPPARSDQSVVHVSTLPSWGATAWRMPASGGAREQNIVASAAATKVLRAGLSAEGGLQVSRGVFGPVTTLEDGDTAAFRINGIDVQRGVAGRAILLAMDSASSYRLPDVRFATRASGLARLDWKPRESVHGFITLVGGLGERYAGISSLSTARHADRLRSDSRTAISGGDWYDSENRLLEWRVGISETQLSARALDPSTSAALIVDGDSGLQGSTLSGGGSPDPFDSRSSRAVDASLVRSASSADNRHEWRYGVALRHDRVDLTRSYEGEGTTLYSMADGTTAVDSVARLILRGNAQSAIRDGMVAAFLGDAWQAAPNLRLELGVRTEVTWLDEGPMPGALVDVPGITRHASVASALPRLGVQWRTGTRTLSLPGVPPAYANEFRLTAGAYQGAVPASRLALTGLNTIGAPLAYICPPITTVNADTLIAGQACLERSYVGDASLASSYRPPLSVRGNVGWSGALVGGLRGSVDLTVSESRRRFDLVDRNLRVAPLGQLAFENNRPLFALPVTSAGGVPLVSSVQSRQDTGLGVVAAVDGDLRSYTSQFGLTLAPASTKENFTWSASYVLSRTNEESRGFLGTTAGDPRVIETQRAVYDVRHQLGLATVFRLGNAVHVILYNKVMSGLPFTPLVGGDINGDGFVNDRAFVPYPAMLAPDQRLAMQQFLDAASPSVRRCIERQLGEAASANSCETPWSWNLNAQLGLNPSTLSLPRGIYVSVGITNALAGLDQLLHHDHPRGWGVQGGVDPFLLIPIAFDSAVRHYSYRWNPEFGRTNAAYAAFAAPSLLTIEARLSLGRSPVSSAAEAMVGPSAVERAASERALQLRLSRSVTNPAEVVLLLRDSLQLTRGQTDSLARLSATFQEAMNRAMLEPAAVLFRLSTKYDADEAEGAMQEVQRRAFEELSLAVPAVHRMLTASQYELLPPPLQVLLDQTRLWIFRPSSGVGLGRALFRP